MRVSGNVDIDKLGVRLCTVCGRKLLPRWAPPRDRRRLAFSLPDPGLGLCEGCRAKGHDPYSYCEACMCKLGPNPAPVRVYRMCKACVDELARRQDEHEQERARRLVWGER